MHLYEGSTDGSTVAEKDGQFGYVGKVFDWRIPPQYDYAYAFQEGLGIVLKNGQYFYIDTNNKSPFETAFAKELGYFKNGRALFKTHSGKVGMLNKQGQIVADTVFKKIYLFDEEVSNHRVPTEVKSRSVTVVVGFKAITHDVEKLIDGEKIRETIEQRDYALIDTNGRFVVPFGVFKHISPFHNGYATASDDKRKVLLNTEGKEVFSLPNDTTRAYEVLTPMVVKYDLIEVSFMDKTAKKPVHQHAGLIDFKGNIVFNDTTVYHIDDYDDKKAIARTDEGCTVIFFEKQADKVIYPTFSTPPNLDMLKKYGLDAASIEVFDGKNGVKWGIIDSCFNWKVPPQYDQVQLSSSEKVISNPKRTFPPYFSLTRHLSKEQAEARQLKPRYPSMPVMLAGLADGTGKILFEPEYGYIDPSDSTFTKFHFMTADGTKRGTMDRNGKVLRQEDPRLDTAASRQMPLRVFKTFNKETWTAQINDGQCKEDIRAELGINKTCNGFKKTTDSDVRKGQTAFINFKENDTTYIKLTSSSEKRKVIKAQLINNTRDTLYFQTRASNQLTINVQAQDDNGIWRDISVVQDLTPYEKKANRNNPLIGLPPQYFWEISLPTFSVGRIKTKCRCIIKTANEDAPLIVSDTWEAMINAAQFWRTPASNPKYTFRAFGSPYEWEDF